MANKPVRTADSAILIRLTTEQKAFIEAAAARTVAGIPGAKMSVGPWVLRLALEAAQVSAVLAAKRNIKT